MEAVDLRSDVRSRTVEASTAEVFAAMRDPVRVARWWGPDGFRSTIHQFQFHAGGRWHLTLHGPDGTDHPNEYRLLRVEADRLLEMDHPSQDHHFVLKIAIRPLGGSTVIAWQQTFDSVADYLGLADFVAQANEQVLDRLAEEARRPAGAD